MRKLIPSSSFVFVALGLVAWAGAPPARADEMDQGEARITARSDVTMAIESGPRTTSMKINEVAKHLGTPLGEIKRCYAQLVKNHPEAAGHIDASITHPEKGPLQIELHGDAVGHKGLTQCVTRSLGKIKLSNELRPARAVVKLEFTNTAAEAAHHVEERREEMAKVDVKTAEDGSLYSQDGTADGKVAFEVKGPSEQAITAAHHGLEQALPRLLDCRRRAGKRGSPAGEIVFGVQIAKSGKANVDVKSSSVAHPNAAPCSRTALRRAQYDKVPARAQVTVRFSE